MHEDRMGFVVNGTTFLIKYFKGPVKSVLSNCFFYGIHRFKLGDFALRVSSGLEFVVIFRFLYKSLRHFSFLVECILSIAPIFGHSCHPDWPIFTNPRKGFGWFAEGKGRRANLGSPFYGGCLRVVLHRCVSRW